MNANFKLDENDQVDQACARAAGARNARSLSG